MSPFDIKPSDFIGTDFSQSFNECEGRILVAEYRSVRERYPKDFLLGTRTPFQFIIVVVKHNRKVYWLNPCSRAVFAILKAYIACLSDTKPLPRERMVPKLKAALRSMGVSILFSLAQFARANQN